MRKTHITHNMKNPRPSHTGFTLMETVIAIGVLAVLLTGFLAVFTPAAQGIQRSIDTQQADRLASTLERELVTLRKDQVPTNAKNGFEKAFKWIEQGDRFSQAIFVYQYRSSTSDIRDDGTPEPMNAITGQPGESYTVQTMARRVTDPLLAKDLKAVEGGVFYVKTCQLVFDGDSLIRSSTPREIRDPHDTSAGPIDNADSYPDAVIAFTAEFYSVPTKSLTYLESEPFRDRYNNFSNPVFTRNLAVRR